MSTPTPPATEPVGYRDAKAQAKAAKAYARSQRPWYKKKRFIIPLALIALTVIGSNMGGGSGNDTATITPASDASTSSSAAVETPATETTSAAPAETKPAFTVSQQNAIQAAKDYLDYSAFSRYGLIEQLSSKAGSGFPKADAIFAVNHIKVNWNEQAAKAAKNYLEYSSFSRAGLIEQLESKAGSGFTHAQAVYGANHAGL